MTSNVPRPLTLRGHLGHDWTANSASGNWGGFRGSVAPDVAGSSPREHLTSVYLHARQCCFLYPCYGVYIVIATKRRVTFLSRIVFAAGHVVATAETVFLLQNWKNPQHSIGSQELYTSRLPPKRTGYRFSEWDPPPPRFSLMADRAGRCRWSACFLRDLQFPPPLHSGDTTRSPRFTLIGSEVLNFKSHLNLCTLHICPR
ncbi:hypothetical protein PR048_032297 [Dryococelus australis]|uniref:Uncharacterized protein n=1 Tax=Dryococelus australis TaxID=614101 RepID=A0ABQ9G1T8_9NEOP|nr:hypothetical protein PR048_032297 [Dryococelus australis]